MNLILIYLFTFGVCLKKQPCEYKEYEYGIHYQFFDILLFRQYTVGFIQRVINLSGFPKYYIHKICYE